MPNSILLFKNSFSWKQAGGLELSFLVFNDVCEKVSIAGNEFDL